MTEWHTIAGSLYHLLGEGGAEGKNGNYSQRTWVHEMQGERRWCPHQGVAIECSTFSGDGGWTYKYSAYLQSNGRWVGTMYWHMLHQ